MTVMWVGLGIVGTTLGQGRQEGTDHFVGQDHRGDGQAL